MGEKDVRFAFGQRNFENKEDRAGLSEKNEWWQSRVGFSDSRVDKKNKPNQKRTNDCT